jgi:hypothetical protein
MTIHDELILALTQPNEEELANQYRAGIPELEVQ